MTDSYENGEVVSGRWTALGTGPNGDGVPTIVADPVPLPGGAARDEAEVVVKAILQRDTGGQYWEEL